MEADGLRVGVGVTPDAYGAYNRAMTIRRGIVRTWKAGFAFQADVVGAVGLGHGAPDTIAEPPGMGARLKYLLALAGVLIVVILLFRSCLASYVQDEMYSPRGPARSAGAPGATP